MAPKHGGGATIRGKQAAVHDGPFLQFLRSVGYRDELPPSTVAWLDSAPVFRFLASKLTRDNFITLEEEQEYNELMLARGPDASLYDAVEGYGSDVEDSSSIATSTRGQKESDPFLADLSDDEVARLLEEEEAYGQQLEQQISVLRGASGTLEATTRQQAESQGPVYFNLTAQAANELSAAKLDAQQLAETLDGTLGELEAVCSELCGLANQPHLWLLCAADNNSYKVMDDHINEQHLRGVHVLDVADVALDLHHPESPAAAAATKAHALAAAGKAAALQSQAMPMLPHAGGAAGGFSTPRGGKQSLADALKEAKEKRRAAHTERNNALSKEMARQQHAFLLGYTREVMAGLKEQGLKAQISAAQQVRARSGEFAALLGRGASAVQELQQQVEETGAAMLLLKERSLKPLMQEVAELNDGHIVVGDYDRHLAKVNYAMDRKRAMLESLMGRASLYLLMLLLCVEEMRRLSVLSEQLGGAAGLMEGQVATIEARLQRCGAALEALERAQGLSNVQADDSYLCALMAAAEGSLVLPGEQQQQQPGAAGASRDPHTPRDVGLPHSRLAPGCALTPSYAPTSRLLERLQHLSDSLDSSGQQLHKLLDLLPAQLDQHKASACRLHRTAFPPGQPMHNVAAGPTAGAGSGSSIAGSVRTAAGGSIAGSTRVGSGAATASARGSEGSLSGLVQHPQLLLTLPEVAEATTAVKGCLDELMAATNRAVVKQNDAVTKLRTKEKTREREVMAKFFNRPEELAQVVDAVKAEVQRLVLDQELGL